MAVYYISTTGDDSAAGTINSPWKTIKHAYDTLTAGDTVFLREGTHHFFDDGAGGYAWWEFKKIGGTAGLPITFAGYPGETAVVNMLFQLTWTQDTATTWHCDATDTPPDLISDPSDSVAHVLTTYGSYTRVHVDGSYPAIFANSQADFDTPPSQVAGDNGQIPFHDADGNLLWDMMWVDTATRTIYFRSNEVEPITDPDTQLWVYGRYCECRFEAYYIESPYTIGDYTFRDLTFGYGSRFAAIWASTVLERFHWDHCWFRNGQIFGIATAEHFNNSILEYCVLDRPGCGIEYVAGVYKRYIHEHALYLLGSSNTIRYNAFMRSLSGAQIHLCNGASPNLLCHDNVLYSGQGLLIGGGDDWVVKNNMFFVRPVPFRGVWLAPSWSYGMYFYSTSDGHAFTHNYFEITDGEPFTTKGDATAATNVVADGNLIFNVDGNDSLLTSCPVNVTWASVDNNSWVGNQDHGALWNGTSYATSTLFLAALVAAGHTGNTYTQLSVKQAIDPNAVNVFLDTEPSIEEIYDYFTAYVNLRRAEFAAWLQGPSPVAGLTIAQVLQQVVGKQPRVAPLLDADSNVHADSRLLNATDPQTLVQAGAAAAVTAYDPPTATEITSAFTEVKGSTWSASTDTLEHIRDKQTDIEADTQDLQAQVGTDGAGLTALPWNAAWDAEVQSEAADAITAASLPTAAQNADAVLDEAKGTHAGFLTTLALEATAQSVLADTGTDGVVVAAESKTGYKLASDGLDQIAATAPTGAPSAWKFPQWIVWLVRRFVQARKTATTLTVHDTNGTAITTQTITEGTTEITGEVAEP